MIRCFLALLLASAAYAYTTTTCVHGETGTCRMTNGSAADVQAAIDASAAGGYGTLTSGGVERTDGTFDGDGVYLPAGAFTWSTDVGWSNKNILIMGAGQGTVSPTASAANASCNSSTNTCITASSGGTNNFMNPTASSTGKMQWRVSNIYVSSTQNAGAIMINSNVNMSQIPSTFAYGFRIDHVTFNYPNASVEGIVLVVGPVFGLIDHCNFVNLGEASICTFAVIPTESDYDNTCGDNVQSLCGEYFFSIGYFPGDARKNLFIEDSKFWTSPSGNGTMFDTYYYGGKVVFRRNQLWNGTFYSHWTGAGANNGMWLEFYNNTHDGTNSVAGYPVRLQGGATGIVYNNTFKNWSDATWHVGEDRSADTLGHGTPAPLSSCNGSRAWDGNAGDPAAPGWPCLAQTGRGNPGITINASNQQSPAAPSYPLYLWNNGTQDACAACTAQAGNCGSCTNTFTVTAEAENYIKSTPHPNGDVDWSKTATQPSGAGTHTLTYTATVYPHPLQGEAAGGTPPTITTTTLPNGTVGAAYSQTLAATGDATITWDLSAGALCSQLSLSSGGTISGTPDTAQTCSFTARATNSAGNDTQALSITIDAAPPAGPAVGVSGAVTIGGNARIQ